MMKRQHFYVAALAAILGCATGTAGTTSSSAGTRSSSVLTAEQIAAFGVEGRSAYDLVSRLRPKWLVVRGVQSIAQASDSTEFALIMVDDHPVGNRHGQHREDLSARGYRQARQHVHRIGDPRDDSHRQPVRGDQPRAGL